jgi:hypothetical protein
LHALAALSFAALSVLVPAVLVVRVTLTVTNKLYNKTHTLLALGPLYNHYHHGSHLFASLLFATNLVFGLVIGAGEWSGTAQAVVILMVEVAAALVTSIWLPWGSGASMRLAIRSTYCRPTRRGAISYPFTCVPSVLLSLVEGRLNYIHRYPATARAYGLRTGSSSSSPSYTSRWC